jgi:putative inorganic carbon (HCO3(-)) transporter
MNVTARRWGSIGAPALAGAAAGALALLMVGRPHYALAAAAGLTAGVLLLRADLALLAMVGAFAWENKLHYPTAAFSAVKGLGALLALAYVIRIAAGRSQRIRLHSLQLVVLALGVWVAISLIASTNPAQSTEKSLRWALFLGFFLIVGQLAYDRTVVRRVLACLTLSASAAAVYALVAFLGAKSGYRAAGPLEDPNDFAYLLACTLPFAALFAAEPGRWGWLWRLCFLALLGATLATFSRGALLAIGVMLVWALATGRVRPAAGLVALFGASALVGLSLLMFSPLIDEAFHQKQHIAQQNTESREALWLAAIELAERRPLTGVGPARFPQEALPLLRNDPIDLARVSVARSVTHNSYLEILSEDGVPALVLFLLYLGCVWCSLARSYRTARGAGDLPGRRLAGALQASLLVAAVGGVFLSEELTAPFWLLGALAVAMAAGRS